MIDRKEFIRKSAQKLKEPKRICLDCGYEAKSLGRRALEDFISHRIEHREWNAWVESWFHSKSLNPEHFPEWHFHIGSHNPERRCLDRLAKIAVAVGQVDQARNALFEGCDSL